MSQCEAHAHSLVQTSRYVRMRDAVNIAVSHWTNDDIPAMPVILITTRYWRAYQFREGSEAVQPYLPLVQALKQQGYSLVIADARGTGASFGIRDAETDQQEVADISELIQWIAEQRWCDGRVVTSGCSYSAITTLYSLSNAPAALKLGVCRAPDFDMYRHLFAPGGIVNRWFIQTWGQVTAAQDNNTIKALFANGYWPEPEQGAGSVLGVLPVDPKQLTAAIHEHANNFNIADDIPALDFIDGFISEKNPPLYDRFIKQGIEHHGVPAVIRCGWHDAGTALGALAMFSSFNHPLHIILGPWNHEGTYRVDPLYAGDGNSPERLEVGASQAMLIDTLNSVLKQGQTIERAVDYFTLGENRWKKTGHWPLPQTQIHRWYFSENYQLTDSAPVMDQGSDQYQVDITATTGRFNRWYAQSPDQPVFFPDRQHEDNKLLVYDSLPLTADTEITGHPLVTLFLSSTASDGQFFVYLETIDPDGRVRLLTEGQLRGLHRKVSEATPPYTLFGPYHSLQQKDAAPMVPDTVTQIAFDLLPLSVLLKKGQRIRVAIAGADADTFDPISDTENAVIRVERNRLHASCIDLPIIPQ